MVVCPDSLEFLQHLAQRGLTLNTIKGYAMAVSSRHVLVAVGQRSTFALQYLLSAPGFAGYLSSVRLLVLRALPVRRFPRIV